MNNQYFFGNGSRIYRVNADNEILAIKKMLDSDYFNIGTVDGLIKTLNAPQNKNIICYGLRNPNNIIHQELIKIK